PAFAGVTNVQKAHPQSRHSRERGNPVFRAASSNPATRTTHRHHQKLRHPAKSCYPSTMKQPCVYILASNCNGTLYIGVTADLRARIWQHRTATDKGFTQRYDVGQLVHFELHDSMENAILREKRLKKWRRAWKLDLIEKHNPDWNDLFDSLNA
ncbi:GIY-YIG nuclease family protein, partial [Thalassospira sp.]